MVFATCSVRPSPRICITRQVPVGLSLKAEVTQTITKVRRGVEFTPTMAPSVPFYDIAKQRISDPVVFLFGLCVARCNHILRPYRRPTSLAAHHMGVQEIVHLHCRSSQVTLVAGGDNLNICQTQQYL